MVDCNVRQARLRGNLVAILSFQLILLRIAAETNLLGCSLSKHFFSRLVLKVAYATYFVVDRKLSANLR